MRLKFDPAQLPDAPDFKYEIELWQRGWRLVGGIDEAGRGALAGPITAAVVIFPPKPELQRFLVGVRDSKQLNAEERSNLAQLIRVFSFAWAVGFASAQEIDDYGILPATRLAVQRAIGMLVEPPEYLLLDFLEVPMLQQPQLSLVKGDNRSLSIAAASILAKTARDAHLVKLSEDYPGYGFDKHKGYGTVTHRLQLENMGPSLEHRRSFRLLPNEEYFPPTR